MSNDQHDNGNNGERRVITPEVLGPENEGRPQGSCGNGQYGNGPCGSGQYGNGPYRQRRIKYFQSYGWPMTSVDQNACLAPVITLILFLVCLFQFGFLAALGFVFFHVLFGVLGSVQATSRMMTGEVFNIWLWRLGNWLFSFLLTVWLAGGFSD